MAKKPYRRPSNRREDAELENAYREISETSAKRKFTFIDRLNELLRNNRMIVIVAICAAVLIILIGICIGIAVLSGSSENGCILQNITVAGVNVGGMTKSDAVSAVHLATDTSYSRQAMTVQVLESKIEISPSVSKVSLDVEAAVKAAYMYGRTGSKHRQNQEQKTAMTTGYTVDLTKFLHLDVDAVRGVLDALGAQYSSTLTQSTYEVTGMLPTLNPSEQPTTEPQRLIITMGTPEYALNMDELYNQVVSAYCSNIFSVEAQCPFIEPDPLDLDTIHAATFVEPVDATLNQTTYEVDEGTCGYGFDLEAAKALLAQLPYGETAEIPFERVMPAVTGENISSTLYRDTLASFTASDPGDSEKNRALADICRMLNGTVINPEGIFYYNKTLGGTNAGYYQVSSALYYCALTADLQVLSRTGCEYASQTYMPLGTDAIVGGSRDLSFRNNTNFPIRIEAEAKDGNVTVSLIGTDERTYYVKIESVVTNTDSYTSGYQIMDADNSEGYTDGQVIVTPYNGYTVETYRCQYQKSNNALLSRTPEATTVYKRQDEVICKIQQPEPEPVPPVTNAPTIPEEQGVGEA